MAQPRSGVRGYARITSSGWNLKDGAHANISAPNGVDRNAVITAFLKSMNRKGEDGLPRDLRKDAEIAFGPARGGQRISIRVLSQSPRGDNFVDYAAKEILKVCRRG
jgi:hypothetical protein